MSVALMHRGWLPGIVSLMLVLWLSVAWPQPPGPVIHSMSDVQGLINPQCGDFRIEGSCSCTGAGVDQACQIVAYHVPLMAVETVLFPGDTVISSSLLATGVGEAIAGAVAGALSAPAEGAFAAGGAANAMESGHTALQFRETHVYTLPQTGFYGCGVCDDTAPPQPPVLEPNYMSELDFTAWRYVSGELAQPLPANLLSGVEVWGSLTPRSGFTRHHELPVGAALLSYRALHIAFFPAPMPPSPLPRTVILPASGVMPICFQVGYPRISRCGRAGMNPVHWDLERIGPHGRNVFIYWGERRCCVDPTETACGLALSASNQDNYCPVPLVPVTGIVPGMPPDVPFDGK